MSSLRAVVHNVITDLDADGGGFRTMDASSLVVERVLVHGLADGDGNLLPMPAQLMRKGAAVAIREYQPERKAAQKVVAFAADGRQSDFAEVSNDFDHWVMDYAALEEGPDAERKQYRRMNYHEIRLVIALKRRKAAEAIAMATLLQRTIDENPGWAQTPERELGDVLGIEDVP